MRPVEIYSGLMGPKTSGPTHGVFVRRGKGERMVSTRMVSH